MIRPAAMRSAIATQLMVASMRPERYTPSIRAALAPSARDRGTLPRPAALSFLPYATRPFRLLREHGSQVLAAALPIGLGPGAR